MDPNDMLSYDPEMERCRQVRAEMDSQYKTVGEAMAHLRELTKTKRQPGKLPAKQVAPKVSKKQKLPA